MDNEDRMDDCELIAFVMLIEALLHYTPWREFWQEVEPFVRLRKSKPSGAVN